VGAFSKRSDQIQRNIERCERDWTAAHPGEQPGPALHQAWDTRAWADARPDKVIPRRGSDLNRLWLDELADLVYIDRDKPTTVVVVPVGGVDRDRAAGEIIARLGAGRSAWNAADVRGEVEQLIARASVVTPAGVRAELAEDITARALALSVALLDPGRGPGAHPRSDQPGRARGRGRPHHPAHRPHTAARPRRRSEPS
jgi:hypothetical protein